MARFRSLRTSRYSGGSSSPRTAPTATALPPVVAPTITLSPLTAISLMTGTPFTRTFSATGGSAPYIYSLAGGSLPAGLSFVGAVLSGTPTTTGAFSFSVRATDTTGYHSATATFAGTVAQGVTVAPLTAISLTVGVPYLRTFTVSGGVPPYFLALHSGALPAGILFDDVAGTLSGTPTTAGNFSFGIQATDTAGNLSAPALFSGTVASDVVAPVLATVGMSPAPDFTAPMALGGTFTNTTDGSVLNVTGGPVGFFFDSAARTWGFNGSASASNGAFAITETLAGAVGSPKLSNVLWTVAAAPVETPVFSVAPVITGTATEGQTLTTTTGTASGSPAYTLRWKRNGVNISGATSSTYVLVSADVGTVITVTSTASNSGGAVTSTSAPTATIAAATTGLDPAISAPTLTLATANTTYPPQFDIALDDTAVVGDTIRLQWDNNADFSSLTGDATNVIDAGEATAKAATFTGLSSITTGTHRFRSRVERGASYGAWSNVVTQGPDDQAPVLTNASSSVLSSASGKVSFTVDEPCTVRFLFPTANVAPSQAAMDASTDTLEVTLAGAKEFTKAGLSSNQAYYPFLQATDAAGNKSAITAAGTFTTPAVPATTWNPANSSNQLTFSNGNLTATGANQGAEQPALANNLKSGKRYFEVHYSVIQSAFGRLAVGLSATLPANFTNPFTAATSAGYNSNGAIRINGTYVADGTQYESTTTPKTIGVAYDTDSGRVWFRLNGGAFNGDPAAGTGGHVVTGLADMYVLATASSVDTFTLRRTAAEVTGSVPTGFLGLDD